MQIRVQMLGDSLTIRIPEVFAAELALTEDALVELSLVNGSLLLTPVVAAAPTLDSLLAAITPGNIHQEVGTEEPLGNEVG